MSLVALALTAALLAPQDPVTHEQAVTCTGVFLFANILMTQAAEADPTPENQETAAAAGRLMKAADDDRLAAARREGIAVDASGQALNVWLEASLPDSEAVVGRELDPCLQRYMSAI
ncbi:hypothetical protein [Brevundimonas fluminis]|jgi:hypothetical protein|uniref:hypothetical protein n=1 Tax=Brevundimonas fluminis TaxID=2487274 RepID=UPI000F657611|nr:hypothetical protein [Brevundimonas fluminis]